MKHLASLFILALSLCAQAQIPKIDSSWQLTESNASRQVFTSPRGKWAIVFGTTNYFPTPIPPPGPQNLWPIVLENLYAQTNGRVADIYSVNTWTGWTNAPTTTRNTSNLIFGAEGFTAFTVHNSFGSSAEQSQAAFGQLQGTAVTPRHVLIRGHGFGATGNILAEYWTNNPGYLFFVTSNNTSIVRRVHATVGYSFEIGSPNDYTVIQLTADLPPSIEPVKIIWSTNFANYFPYTNSPFIPFFACQHNLSTTTAALPGFQHNNWVGGDSGSADYILLPNEDRRFTIALYGIRSGSRILPQIQVDINNLCDLAGISSSGYQMQPANLTY